MPIKTFEELQRADERTLRFLPGLQLRPEDAAEYQQQVAGRFELDPRVAEGTRRSYEHLRTVFAYGVLCFEIYTLVGDHALLVVEQALRDRFVDFHSGTAVFVDHTDAEHHVAVDAPRRRTPVLPAHRPPRGAGLATPAAGWNHCDVPRRHASRSADLGPPPTCSAGPVGQVRQNAGADIRTVWASGSAPRASCRWSRRSRWLAGLRSRRRVGCRRYVGGQPAGAC